MDVRRECVRVPYYPGPSPILVPHSPRTTTVTLFRPSGRPTNDVDRFTTLNSTTVPCPVESSLFSPYLSQTDQPNPSWICSGSEDEPTPPQIPNRSHEHVPSSPPRTKPAPCPVVHPVSSFLVYRDPVLVTRGLVWTDPWSVPSRSPDVPRPPDEDVDVRGRVVFAPDVGTWLSTSVRLSRRSSHPFDCRPTLVLLPKAYPRSPDRSSVLSSSAWPDCTVFRVDPPWTGRGGVRASSVVVTGRARRK